MLSKTYQSGAALLVSLVILLILSIIGISAMRGGLLQTLMATNTQQLYMAQNVSDGAAESMYYQTNVEKTSAGNMMSSAISGNVVSFGIAPNGSLSGIADIYIDGDRDKPMMRGRSDLVFIGCGANDQPGAGQMCAGYSIKPGSSTGCNVFRVDAQGTVGDTSSNTELWLAAFAAC